MAERIKRMKDSELERISGGAYTGSVFLYTVQDGDSLSVIAHRFGTTVKTIGELNDITSAESVYPGVMLLLPLKG